MRKKHEDEIEDDEDIDQERWDFKRLLIGLPLIIFVLFLGLKVVPPKVSQFSTQVLGVSEKNVPDKKEPFSETKQEAGELLRRAKETLSNLKVEDVSSNSGTLEKVINDLKSLQSHSKGPKDILCEYVCRE